MIKLQRGYDTWWRKPLALVEGRHLPAELAILNINLQSTECGVWLNTRGVKSGVVDLIAIKSDGVYAYHTRRIPLPIFVSNNLARIYQEAGLRKGIPDLVIWNKNTEEVRFIEVKCPHWDRPSIEQEKIIEAIASIGIDVSIVEWEFNYPE